MAKNTWLEEAAPFHGILLSGAVEAARSLVGWRFFVVEANGSRTGGMIAETEAYTQEDAASHTFRGQTVRNTAMFGPAGNLYVYFTYGMHWCANIVTGQAGHGEGVLLRALRPESGVETIRRRRGNQPDLLLTNGPAKICQALAITGSDNGVPIDGKRFVVEPPVFTHIAVQATPRIGIKHDTHRLWRFVAVD